MRLLFVQNEKLALVGIWATIRHRQLPSLVMHIIGMEFIGECDFVAPNTRLLSRHMRCVPSLDHKSLDISVKHGFVVLSGGTKREKIEARPRRSVTKHFEFEITDTCMDSDGHDSRSRIFLWSRLIWALLQ